MSRKFIKKFTQAKTFRSWLDRLKRFDYELIKANNLQRWTLRDYKNYWIKYKGAL